MRILLVNWQDRMNPHAGGAEIHLFELFGRLAKGGHEVHLVCSGWPGAPATATIDGITVERHGGRHTFALAGRRAVRRALAARPYDCLVEDINKLPLYCEGLTSLPVCVVVPHLFGATAYQEASWSMATAVVLAERFIPAAYRDAAFHAISESTRDDLVARGIEAARIAVIHPGIDSDHFCPEPGLDRSDPPSFLYVGRLRRYKGVEYLIRALGEVRRTNPRIRLDIAGTGDDQARLVGLAASLGLSDAVRFHGFVDEATKLRLLRTTWGHVFPSPKEGWGITIMEAAGCGTPSIASDSPGLRDSVRAGVTGFLVPHGNVGALAERMLVLAGNRAAVESLGSAARTLAQAWSWGDAARATEEHLRKRITP